MRKQPSSCKGRLVPHMRAQPNRGGRRKTRDGSSRTWRVRLGRRKTRDSSSRTWRVRAFRSSQRRCLRRTAMRISMTRRADQHARAMQIGRLGEFWINIYINKDLQDFGSREATNDAVDAYITETTTSSACISGGGSWRGIDSSPPAPTPPPCLPPHRRQDRDLRAPRNAAMQEAPPRPLRLGTSFVLIATHPPPCLPRALPVELLLSPPAPDGVGGRTEVVLLREARH
ncbi:hypothetical protein GUJ93_ZPchr0013g34045 [Zizania palustris]|uniref:Uncharacterized protein n=1 Tax=Zizania palustris TaxID=103762 RepID=A0A8J5X2Z8_ZIZPA|nr:hypothetical protein GUJ93_ZPchr0013g34045 [Zizania palustris]